MHIPCSPDTACREALQIVRDEVSGCITVRLRLDDAYEEIDDDILSLLSCWWLRWIATFDCDFFQDENGWLLHCRLEPNDHAMLSHVLRDMLAIKNSVCQ